MIIHTKQIAQQDAQSMTELIAHLVTMQHKIEPVPVEAERFCLLFGALHLYFQDAIMQKETLVTDWTQLEKTALLFESTVVPSLNIMMKRPSIARHDEAPKHEASL